MTADEAQIDAPPTMAWLVGHTAFGGLLLVALAVMVPPAGLAAYVTVGAVAIPVDAAKARQPRRTTTWAGRAGWTLLLPAYALGMAVHGLLDLAP